MITHLIADSSYTHLMAGAKRIDLVSKTLKDVHATYYPQFVRINNSVAVDPKQVTARMKDGRLVINVGDQNFLVAQSRQASIVGQFGIAPPLGRPQYLEHLILSKLEGDKPICTADLVERVGHPRLSVTKALGRMQKAGRIKRHYIGRYTLITQDNTKR